MFHSKCEFIKKNSLRTIIFLKYTTPTRSPDNRCIVHTAGIVNPVTQWSGFTILRMCISSGIGGTG